MYLSKHKSGIYYLYYRTLTGTRNKISTKTKNKSEAYDFLVSFKKEFKRKMEDPLTDIKLSHFRLKFLAYSESIHSWNHTLSMKSTLNELIRFQGDGSLKGLDKLTVQKFIEHRLRNVTGSTVRRDIANLSSAFKWAISQNYLKDNLTAGIKKPKVVEKMPLYFTEREFHILINSIESLDLKDIINFAILTGLRQSELISLRWSQIIFDSKILILDNRNRINKSRKIHNMPLNEKAMEILNRRYINPHKEGYVFTYLSNPIKQLFISHKFKKLVRAAGLNPELSFHCLRHTFASWLVQKGVSIYVISKLLGHSDIRVTQVYSHLQSENLRDTVKLLE